MCVFAKTRREKTFNTHRTRARCSWAVHTVPVHVVVGQQEGTRETSQCMRVRKQEELAFASFEQRSVDNNFIHIGRNDMSEQ